MKHKLSKRKKKIDLLCQAMSQDQDQGGNRSSCWGLCPKNQYIGMS